MASRIFDRLAAEKGAQMEAIFRQVDSLKEDTMARARQICRLAALLHDTGHCCFSHAAESVIHKDSDHESMSVNILCQPEFLGTILTNEYFEGCPQLTASLIMPGSDFAPQLQLLRDIVSGQVDADRSDYLLRDSLHCGVDYGRFDHLRLIECLTCWQDEDSEQLTMAINRDGVHSFESLILARYQMNTQVYYHRLRRIYDYYLKRYFESLGKQLFDTPEKVLEWNDIKATNQLFLDANDSSSAGYKWASRIVNRKHHKDVFSLDEGDGPHSVKIAKKVAIAIQSENTDIDFIVDLPDKPISIHKIARDDEDDNLLDDFPLIERNRKTSLGERSQLMKHLPKTFRIGYIFANIDDSKKRNEVATRCRQLGSDLS